ncbi:hypothetical protein DLAC_09921 [Tieghemostelium lacteum]|uniref:Phospholipid scramblase n=1 Tax=Tieghemostelium lacteum TaxID=361077 RepID=A0A151Z5M3_TIELA|nr:hypothetical protein DLAC_09921 [Tieghemostelium lacteum]|eukprot:KYQ89262.1 hypothetical protein DLAC_09921 [Tieghemostelium lacteum]
MVTSTIVSDNGITINQQSNKSTKKYIINKKRLTLLGEYKILDENNKVLYLIKGDWGIGRKLHVLDANSNHLATIKQTKLFWPKYDILNKEGHIINTIERVALFKPNFSVLNSPISLKSDFFGFNFEFFNKDKIIGSIKKTKFSWNENYEVTLEEPEHEFLIINSVLIMDSIYHYGKQGFHF